MDSRMERIIDMEKLERYYHSVLHFKTRMTSYVYEPNTLSLHETKELILAKISVLTESISAQLHHLRGNKEQLSHQYHSLGYYFQEIANLEKQIVEYTLKMKVV